MAVQVGSTNCLDLTERQCIVPQYGSLLDLRGQFYTREDYREILRYAAARHVQVIPEIDLPGHSNAAIKAMESR